MKQSQNLSGGLAADTPAVLTSQETEERKARRLLEHGQHTETLSQTHTQ